MSEPHINQKLMRILFNRPAIEAAYFAAHRRAAELRQQLRELELQIAQAQELIDLTPDPPLATSSPAHPATHPARSDLDRA